VTFRDETSLAAIWCSGISAVDLPYLFTVMINFACWSILGVDFAGMFRLVACVRTSCSS